MARTAKSAVYVGEETLVKIDRMAQLWTAEAGRRVTYGEAVERAMDIALEERAQRLATIHGATK